MRGRRPTVRREIVKDRLYLFDTTLRDGAQTPGVDFSVEDKVQIAALVEKLGIDYVEGGWPGANPADTELFSRKRTTKARFTAFGMTKRAGRSAANDPGLAAVLEAEADAVCLVAKSWDFHVEVALKTTLEENLVGLRESVEAVVARGREALIDCEHFFDGYKANRDYALACATPMAARCLARSRRSFATSRRWCRAPIWASTPMTTPATRSPIRWPPCAPAPARSRAR